MPYKNLIMPKVRVSTGLYSHLDSIIKIDKNVLDWIKNSNATKPKKLVLDSVEEVIYSLKNSIKNGNSESMITEEVYNELNSLFPKREIRTGGNGNNMGRTLFELGLVPLVSYPLRPEKLMKASLDFKVAIKNNFVKPKDAIRNDPSYDHIIFEAEKWRNILPWDLMTSQGMFDEDFLNFAFNSKFTDIAIISYAHILLPQYKKRTDFLLEFIKSKRPRVHLEFGLGCEKSMTYAMGKLSENEACDSWGLDEKECALYLKANSEEREDLIEATLKAIKDYNIKRICVHTPKFAFSLSKYDTKKEIEALTDACYEAGLKLSDKVKSQKGKILKKKIKGFNFCLVPSFFVEHPKKITGVGDAFAAVQAVKILS